MSENSTEARRLTYTARDICRDVLHCSPRSLQRMVATHRFPAPLRPGKKPIWSHAQVERFLSGKTSR